MKEVLLSRLRDHNTTRKEFRETTQQLGLILAQEAALHLPTEEVQHIETPLAKAMGKRHTKDPLIIPIEVTAILVPIN